MKVIDLLNKIANGEEVPKKIKYENYIYWYVKDWKDYKNAQVEYESYLISCRYHKTDFLNEEVEIIEDTPEEKNKKKQEVIANLLKDNANLELRINKAVRVIVKNAIASDKWEEISPLEFTPIGEITYKSLNKNKVRELDKILKGEE